MDINTPNAPAWARRLTDSYGNDLRGPAELLAAHVKRYSSKETRRKYLGNIGQFFRWMERWHPETHLLSVKPAHIELYREYLISNHWDGHPGECSRECRELPYDTASRKAKISAISSFYEYCVTQDRVPKNPVNREPSRDVSGDDGQEHMKDVLMPHEIVDVMQTCRRAVNGNTAFSTPTLRAAVVFGAFVGPGLRCEELEKSRAENLGWRGRTRTLRFLRKGGYWQTIDLPDQWARDLDAYLGDRKHGPLILNERQRRRNPQTGELEHAGLSDDGLRNVMTEIGQITGVRDRFYPHLARHTSITLALTDPHATPQRVMAYYGHLRIETTMRYYNYMRLLTPGRQHNVYGINWKTQGLALAI